MAEHILNARWTKRSWLHAVGLDPKTSQQVDMCFHALHTYSLTDVSDPEVVDMVLTWFVRYNLFTSAYFLCTRIPEKSDFHKLIHVYSASKLFKYNTKVKALYVKYVKEGVKLVHRMSIVKSPHNKQQHWDRYMADGVVTHEYIPVSTHFNPTNFILTGAFTDPILLSRKEAIEQKRYAALIPYIVQDYCSNKCTAEDFIKVTTIIPCKLDKRTPGKKHMLVQNQCIEYDSLCEYRRVLSLSCRKYIRSSIDSINKCIYVANSHQEDGSYAQKMHNKVLAHTSSIIDECIVCYEKVPLLLMSCGHQNICSSCFIQYKKKKCTLCNTPIYLLMS
jgi:hypothetical protein